jgi:hypothetical protein
MCERVKYKEFKKYSFPHMWGNASGSKIYLIGIKRKQEAPK